MAYHTPVYLVCFLPCALVCYQVVKQKYRWLVLLLFSYLFFFAISQWLIIFLWLITGITYGAGIWIEKTRFQNGNRVLFCAGVFVLLGILFAIKYVKVCPVAPIGISFYILEAVSYLADIRMEKIHADRNPGKVALYLAFFPQLMEGPFAKYEETAELLYQGNPVTGKNLIYGTERIVWGLFKKLVIADRMHILVKTVFDNYAAYNGTVSFVAGIFCTVQLYMEFSGCMDIITGSGEIFGVKLPENFRQPFFSKTASEFWRRWHITLGRWFKDYIFYPISMSETVKHKNSRVRKKYGKYMAKLMVSACTLLPVWICNGLWHGPHFNYFLYGIYYFVVIYLEIALEPVGEKIKKSGLIPGIRIWYELFQRIRTIGVIFAGELFFRADSVTDGINMFGKILKESTVKSFWDGTMLGLGLDIWDFGIILAALVIVLFVSIQKEKGTDIRRSLAQRSMAFRMVVSYGMVLSIVIFGAYGAGYVPVDLIYAGF